MTGRVSAWALYSAIGWLLVSQLGRGLQQLRPPGFVLPILDVCCSDAVATAAALFVTFCGCSHSSSAL